MFEIGFFQGELCEKPDCPIGGIINALCCSRLVRAHIDHSWTYLCLTLLRGQLHQVIREVEKSIVILNNAIFEKLQDDVCGPVLGYLGVCGLWFFVSYCCLGKRESVSP